MPSGPNIIAIEIGNSRIHLGQFLDGKLQQSSGFDHEETTEIVQMVVGWWTAVAGRPQAAILLASVHEEMATRLASAISGQLSVEIYRVGDDLPVPIGRQLSPETITGVDRLLNAAAAYDRLQQACIVVDAGTAVTVDFIDGEGTFHGGAIAPGAAMQLQALHEHTASLPELRAAAPDDEAFGRSTAQAMLHGVFHGIRGLVWKLVEIYAERYGAYPQVIATGGDAELLFADDALVDRIVPELTLLGIAVAARHALVADEDADARRSS
ncbi:MAG: type III pantothenate kinase [Planctomycetota bacterium]|jgi:type III pantothenate kinase